MTAPPGGPSLISRLLEEQQNLTAVERFARDHDEGDVPAQAKHYSKLLPASPPGDGQQYAFDVDLDRCSGCKACVTACHSLNGLDEGESWRDVGLLVGGTSAEPLMQHVTAACHHCLDPACMTACPVNAYEKDPITGIVKHLDDQCFGCQYCTLACPYDVPKYHHEKGIVRKCDMCSDRLTAGEAPACAQACPHEAIAIRVVDREQVMEDSEADPFLPAAPDPDITLPTTVYRTNRAFPRNTLPADYYAVHPEHAHWPLVVMLVLTQLSVGAVLVQLLLEGFLGRGLIAGIRPVHSLGALIFGLVALGASTLHLGRPHLAYRAVIGLRHSWLSREIVAFGVFAVLAVAYAGVNWLGGSSAPVSTVLGWGVGATGIIGVACSIMIYVFTRRDFWSGPMTSARFLLTTALLGVAAVWLTLMLVSLGGTVSSAAQRIVTRHGATLCTALMATAVIKLLFEASLLRYRWLRRQSPLKRSALLMSGPLSNVTLARFACGVLGGLLMPSLLLLGQGNAALIRGGDVFQTVVIGMLFAACLAGELLERFLFFVACAPPRMPGALGG